MRTQLVSLLDARGVRGVDAHHDVGRVDHLAALSAGESNGNDAHLLGLLEGADHVEAVATGADADEHVALASDTGKRP